jgi:hypothetical protein
MMKQFPSEGGICSETIIAGPGVSPASESKREGIQTPPPIEISRSLLSDAAAIAVSRARNKMVVLIILSLLINRDEQSIQNVKSKNPPL